MRPRSTTESSGKLKESCRPPLWYYKDASQKIVGPFTGSEIAQQIHLGRFDGVGSTQFKRDTDRDFKTLEEWLPEIFSGQIDEARRRITLAKLFDSTDVSRIPVVREEPMKLADTITDQTQPSHLDSLDIGRISSAEIVRNLHGALASCDLDVVLIPSQVMDDEEEELSRPSLAQSGAWIEREERAWLRNQLIEPQKIIILPVLSAILKVSPILRKRIELLESSTTEDSNSQLLGAELISKSFEPSRRRLILRVVNPEAFRVIIRFLYGFIDEVHHVNPHLLPYIIKDAAKIQLPRLVEITQRALCESLDPDLIVKVCKTAEFLHLENLFQECITLLAECGFVVLSGMNFVSFSLKMLRSLFEQDNLMLDEVQVYGVLSLWVNKRLEEYLADNRSNTSEVRTTLDSANVKRTELLGRFLDLIPEVAVGTRRILKIAGKNVEGPAAIPPCLRLEKMSVKELFDIRNRDGSIDTAILNAFFRKNRKFELPSRVHPWQACQGYRVEQFDTSFPLQLLRVNEERKRPTDEGSGRFWTCGSSRAINEAFWCFEILTLKSGNLSIGIMSEAKSGAAAHPNFVRYFDTQKRMFHTASVRSLQGEPLHRAFPVSSPVRSWTPRLRPGDLLYVRLTVSRTTIHMTLGVFTTQLLAHHNFPLDLAMENLTRLDDKEDPFSRSWVRVRPWFVLYDDGDMIGLPELVDRATTQTLPQMKT